MACDGLPKDKLSSVNIAEQEPHSPIENESESEGGVQLPATSPQRQHAQTPYRPEAPRSSTEPTPAALLHKYFETNPGRQSGSQNHSRNRSPYSRSHLRSRSGGSALAAPPMTRAHSLPSVNTARTGFDTSASPSPSSGSLSPSPAMGGSPLRTPVRVRSPFKQQAEEANHNLPLRSPVWSFDGQASSGASSSGIESIQEDSELELAPRPPPLLQPAAYRSSTSAHTRRRPASPLHNLQHTAPPTSFSTAVVEQNGVTLSVPPHSGSSSPALGPQRFNEAYPSLHHYASTSSFSSIPSTPTSARSRSPSISSLDTIEDAPDAESEAVEEERMERLKLAAERAERVARGEVDESAVEDDPRRRRSLDTPRVGFGFFKGGVGRERKRWSVCGGERRADLDLETIWED